MESLQKTVTLIKSQLGIAADTSLLQLGMSALGAVAALLLLAWAAASLWRKLRPQAKLPAMCGCMPEKPATLTQGLPSWFERALLTLDYLRTRREWRYAKSWLMLLGETGGGKSSILASIPPAQQNPLHERQRELAIEGVNWHGVGKSFLLDPVGLWPSAAASAELAGVADSSEHAKKWYSVLDQLSALRPERALDGVLLIISAASLQTLSREQRFALAANARQQLLTIEQRTEFALPVYVLVTACDSIDGFAAFWRSQELYRRDEMAGWSAPLQISDNSPEAWANAAFDLVGQQLQTLQVAAAKNEAIASGDADGFFLFPRHFEQLRTPFAGWLAAAFQDIAWQTGSFCRGVYFTGVVADNQAQTVAQETPRKDVSFIHDLLFEKVLAEPHLARPSRRGVWSRNALLRRLQWIGLSAFSLLCLAFVIASVQIHAQVDAVIGGLKLMQQLQPSNLSNSGTGTASSSGGSNCVAQEPVYQLLGQIARIDAKARSWLIPLSWFDDRLSRQSARRLANDAFKGIILPGLACQLNQRGVEVSKQTFSVASGSSYQDSLAALNAYVQQVKVLEQNTARFQRLLGISPYAKDPVLLAEFIQLTEYAYRTALPAKMKSDGGLLPATLASLTPAYFTGSLQMPLNLKTNVANYIDTQAAQVQQRMSAEIGNGSAMLLKLEEKQAPILANIKNFTGWLDWVRKSWLGSSATNNPLLQVQTELANSLLPLIVQYGYPATTLQHASAQFDAANNYPRAMASLTAMQMPQYGALFVNVGGQMTLNPKLLTELIGLQALIGLDYMQLDPLLQFSCKGKLNNWNVVYLNQATQYAKNYNKLMNSALLQPSAAQSLYRQLALYQLELAMNHSLQQAQTIAIPGSFDANPASSNNGSNELRQDQDSAAFAKLLPALQSLQKTYRTLGLNSSGTSLGQCATQFASAQLGQIQLLSDQSVLYQPSPAPSAKGQDAAFFDLGSTAVIKDYLARQVSRVQVLTGYAGPYLDYLNQADTTASPPQPNTSSAPYWNNTVTELKNYQLAKDPNAQPSQLDTLFLKQYPGLTNGNCSKTLSAYQSPALGNDLFSSHRQQLEKQVPLRCKGERYAQADSDYQALAARFNRELAGRYPFGALESDDAASATVKAFFTDYAAIAASLRQSLADLPDASWDNARNFLTQLDNVNTFFAASLLQSNATQGTEPNASAQAVKLKVTFRAQPSASEGSDQIATWNLSSGAKTISYPNRGSSLDWEYGQPLVLDVAWANRSLWRPTAGGNNSDLQIDGNTASFAASGEWALLRMIERHNYKASGQADQANGNTLLLQFSVPVINSSSAGKAVNSNATLYLSLKLSSNNAKAPVSLTLPAAFPKLAPQ